MILKERKEQQKNENGAGHKISSASLRSSAEIRRRR